MKTIKTISKLTMLFAFVAFANTLMAAGNLKVNIRPLESEKAVVEISNTTASNFQISIENEKGETVYYKETGADSNDFNKVFDFSELENGNYKLSVAIDGLSSERSFKINNSKISVGKEKTNMAPYFAYKDGVLKLSYLNFSEENINLNLYNSSDLVYSKEIGNKFNITEGYNLSKLDKGTYSVVLSTGSKSYSYDINVE